jgi:FSR family fosmidomycin resistance protein-like MFS transporter
MATANAISAIPQDDTDAEQFRAAGVLTVVGGHAVHDTYTAFLPPLLPVLIEKFSLSTSQAGLLSVFLQWPSLLQPFIGHLADHVNLRYFVILAPAITAAAMSLLGIAPSYAVAAMLLIVVGLSAAALHAVGPVTVGNLAGRNLGRGMGLWMVGGGLGYTVGPLLLVAALDVLKLEGIPWLMAGGIVASAVLYVRLRDVSTYSTRFRRAQPWRQALHTMRPLLVPVLGIIIVRSFMAAALSTYLPLFLSQEGGSLWLAGASLSVYEAAGMAGALVIGSVSDRLGRRRVLAVAIGVTAPLMMAFLATRSLAQFPILVAIGFCAMSVMPVMLALLQENFPENRALVSGLYMGLSFVITATATVALGALGDRFGLRAAFTLSAALPLLGVPLIWLLPAGRPRTDTKEPTHA